MNPGGAVFAFVAVAGFAWLIWFVIGKERERSQAREQRATERGWTYAKGGKPGLVYTVQGAEGGTQWTLEAFQGGQHKAGRTTWKTPDPPLTGGVVFIGSKAMAAFLKNPIGHKLAQWGLQIVLGGDDVSRAWSRLMEGYQEVDTGDMDFAASYAVLATDPGQAQRFLTGDVRRGILDWDSSHKIGRASRGQLGVTWSDAGLSLTWSASALGQADDMVAFVELCLLMRSSARSGW